MNIDHTPKELAQAIKLAHSLKLYIKVIKYEHATYIEISGLPVGCGFGVVQVRMARSDRKHVRMMRDIKACRINVNMNYKTNYYEISNDPWSVAQAEKLGAVVMKRTPTKTKYVICTQAQKDWYDNEVMKRNKP